MPPHRPQQVQAETPAGAAHCRKLEEVGQQTSAQLKVEMNEDREPLSFHDAFSPRVSWVSPSFEKKKKGRGKKTKNVLNGQG
jgi:hypothetical protein